MRAKCVRRFRANGLFRPIFSVACDWSAVGRRLEHLAHHVDRRALHPVAIDDAFVAHGTTAVKK
jgi:hypothetical protein